MFCFNLIQHKRTLEQLSSISADKEELSQRCHELDEQVKMLYTCYNYQEKNRLISYRLDFSLLINKGFFYIA